MIGWLPPFGRDGVPPITTEQRIDSNSSKIQQHTAAIFEVADFGTIIMPPRNRNFDNPHPAVHGIEQYFRIEPPTLNRLQKKESSGSLIRKGLETALRIDKRQPNKKASHQVEAAAEKSPIQRLLVGLKITLQPP